MQEKLTILFKTYTGHEPSSVVKLAGAGSNRKYYRLSDGGFSAVGVIGDNVSENEAFLYLAGHFCAKGLNVPEVYAVSGDCSCYLQEDLGDVTLYDAVAKGRETGIYSEDEQSLLLKVVSMLPDVQFRGAEGLDYGRCWPDREFCTRMVLDDLNYFRFCFLKATGVGYDEASLDRDFHEMAVRLVDDEWNAFMYRDFQARNVMLKDGEPYFIDFQGGRCGPCHYDLASFVCQAKARYPKELKARMVDTYLDAMGEYIAVSRPAFLDRLRLHALLRTLQVLGAYGFRGYFERKPHFLTSIPFAIANLREMLPIPDYPALDGVLQRLVALPRFAAPEAGSGRMSGNDSGCIREKVSSSAAPENGRLTVDVCSFSYKKGIPEDGSGNGGGYVFDCRSIHNPGRYEQYKPLTGKDREVIDFLETDGEVFSFLDHVYGVVDPHVETFMKRGFTHLMVSFGCTGGRHRSVYCAESLATHLRGKYDIDVVLTHREHDSWPAISHFETFRSIVSLSPEVATASRVSPVGLRAGAAGL